MTKRPAWNASLLAAGILTAGMGLYHFFLPAQFGWGEELAHERMLRWALLSINTFFSYLLLAGGALTIAIAVAPRPREAISTGVLAAMTGFWLVNAAYQFLLPMPLPPRLAILGWVLRGFAIVVVLLYAWGLQKFPRDRS
jgi:uncharacterized membrane protein